MRWFKVWILTGVLALPAVTEASGRTFVSLGFNFGGPPVYRPYWHPYPYYYRPYPVVVAPAPVYVEPAPVVIQRPIVVQQMATEYTAPAPQPQWQAPAPAPAQSVQTANPGFQANIDVLLNQLSHQDDGVRASAVMELGRMKAERAVESLVATLAGDRSPQVRESAARALGLIGSTRALTALTYAAQADSDRDVRHSAQFSVEIIRSHLR